MENKEYLSEDKYLESKRKITFIALIILVVGTLIGGSLIVTGIVKTNNAKKVNEINRNNNASVSRNESVVQADIDSVKVEVDALSDEISNLEKEKSTIFQEDKGFSDRYYAKDDEITARRKEKLKLETKLSNLETELWKVQSGYNDAKNMILSSSSDIETGKYVAFYIFGGFIIAASLMISGSVYFFAIRREITAFTVQQVMPVAQEGIEKMAPTVGKAAGTIVKDITKGIKDGIKDDEK